MGFFSKRSKKKAAKNAKTESQTPQKAAATPEVKPEPATPDTVEAPESPESPTEETVQTPEEAGAPTSPAKPKHRTRISVTTSVEIDVEVENPSEEDEDQGGDKESDEDPGLSDAARQVLDDIETTEGIEKNTTSSKDDQNENTEDSEIGDESRTEAESAVVVDGANDTPRDATSEPQKDDEDGVSKNLLGTFDGCGILPDSLKAMLPESWQDNKEVPDEPETFLDEAPKKVSYYSEDFAVKFLQEFKQTGFALVYHQPSLTLEEEKADWQGRSVTMNFKPGACNALEVLQPGIEWSTMGGGKEKNVLTRSVDLINIHSIIVSSSDDMRDDLDNGDIEEIQCFFTLTTKTGEIHVFEALNKDESNRLVIGIRNMAGRYSNLTVSGDPRVMVDFFDNESDPQEIRLPFDRAIVHVSHAFLG